MGAIVFDNKVAEVRPAPGTDKVTATFTYRNTGPARDRIYQIETNCGCLSAKVDRYNLEPGQSGTLTAVFNIKGKSGAFGKGLSVVAGMKRETIPLEVHVFVPRLIELEPEALVWKVGEKASTKTVRVQMKADQPIRILRAESSRPTVTANLVTIAEGKSYEIQVTPQSTSGPVLGVVRLDTDCPIAEQRRQMAFFRVEK